MSSVSIYLLMFFHSQMVNINSAAASRTTTGLTVSIIQMATAVLADLVTSGIRTPVSVSRPTLYTGAVSGWGVGGGGSPLLFWENNL